jgi:hypothetical protein
MQPVKTPVQVVLEIYAAIRDGNVSDLLTLTDPRIACRPVVRPGLSIYHDHDGMAQLVTDMHAVHGDYHVDIGTVDEQPGPIITVHATINPVRAGRPQFVTTVFTLRKGRVATIESDLAVAAQPG